MVRALAAAVLVVVLSGCSDSGTDFGAGDAADGPAPAGPDRMATPPSREALPPVDDAVDADLSFAANACAAGECVVEPFGARYVHARTQQDLLAGALHVEATPVIAAEELLVLVVVYEGCPESCEVAEELVRHVGIEQAFDLVVPRFQLVEGQQVGVRTSLRVPVGEAYTTGGWDVQLTGTLTFEGS